jgi:hypothetical protein
MRHARIRAGAVLVLALLGATSGAATSAPTSAAGAAAPAALATRILWVDPVRGNDTRTGATAALALRTLTAAWNRIPASRRLDRPVRIMVKAGTIAPTAAPNYWEKRWGTAAAPISIVSADGPGRAQLPSINMFDVRHLTFDGIAVRSPFDAFHCERCSHIELRRSAFVGIGNPALGQGPQEAVKINQSDNVRIVDSYLAGATDNALDLVAVRHAYVARTTIAHATDWCAYAKGGSTDVEFDANHVHGCGTGGITLGQGTGLQFMVAPWTNYEAYGSRVTNSVLHDIEGASLAVNGGYAVLLAHNTAYRTGTRDHLLGVVFGERSCDGEGEGDADCARIRDAGGWGPRAAGGDPTPIGNRGVAIVDNLVYNPDGVRSRYSHFAVYGPRPAPDSGGPDPAVADDGLVIRGNTIWNGPADVDLGLGGEQGCADGHPTCSPDRVLAENAVNTVRPTVRVVAGRVPVPVPGGALAAGTGAGLPLPALGWSGEPARRGVPVVEMPTTVLRDRAGVLRAGQPWRPGAYLGDAATSTVRVGGLAGRGTVTSRADGVLRGAGGSLVVLRGDWLELTARAVAGRRFTAWTGVCAGQRGTTCLVRASTATLDLGVQFT